MPEDSPTPIFSKLDAACSRLSHRVGRRWIRPLLQAIQPQAILQIINQSQRTLAALPVFFADLEKQGFKARSLADLETAVNA